MASRYYDYFAERWCTRPPFPPLAPRRLVVPHTTLLAALVEEIEQGDDLARLYTALLARQLIGNDHRLMEKYGRRIVELTTPEIEPTKTNGWTAA